LEHAVQKGTLAVHAADLAHHELESVKTIIIITIMQRQTGPPWVEIDPQMETLASTCLLQPDWMWAAQLERSKDTAAQSLAVAGLAALRPTTHTAVSALEHCLQNDQVYPRYALSLSLLNPKTSITLQERPSYSGNLNSETPGDSTNAFLHWGDVLGDCDSYSAYLKCQNSAYARIAVCVTGYGFYSVRLFDHSSSIHPFS